ncbi:ATP-dependent RNA helicase HrpA [Vallicoccus soli]|uniref:RNA helicase n=1 Tax=Vallicoccus soli TaxID=2339232 RepID=A0A3A3ZIT5_9ACTN|nr:ATP-dependent RNA helicase HrpA [Vallicoccus soli]RJK95382.1 ATP-dependent RNA helicase HrpA [Vallicoccus soli]
MTAPTTSRPDRAERERVQALTERLAGLQVRDEHRLGRRLEGLRRQRDPGARARTLDAVEAEVAAAEQRVERRRAAVPRIAYPEQLPVSQRREDILAAIRDHQVVIVAGETGSGKTTQLPKLCLELGRGVRGLVGHTQPRRIAARTVAERIAEELGTPLGSTVGYQVRFTDRAGDDTLVKLMTDGILLAEIQRDRLLSRYDTIIVDEAHERSLNIDFILGYLKQLLPRRPDLKVVITSATIDPQRFSEHFDGAPVVEVSGRTYPVEVRYRPLVEDLATGGDEEEDGDGDAEPVVRDQTQAICDAVQELQREGDGDVLVFLSGEREIRDTADALRRLDLRHTEVVPLYARLSAGEQHRVFQPHTGRRVVLATNVAETSLTVPGIRYVVDPGTARISRYSSRLKVQRLPIEPVSQASANQRTGRCGRVAEGICIRLYSEEDFLGRPEFTDPEILRTSLASVILQMTALGLGDIVRFPFVEPPDRRQVKDGLDLLHELGAIDPGEQDPRKRLTETGRQLAQLPLDPRLARMVLEGQRNGCAREVMVVAAALSIQDPRERPVEAQQAADEKHRRFQEPDSDFLAWLKLWDYLQEQQEALSSGQFRRLCKREFLHYLRVREWQDVFGQLRQMARAVGVTADGPPADPQRLHASLLAGLLSHIGLKDPEKQDYVGARGARFALWPGSGVARKRPRWVMAAELVETSRLWGRTVARIEPEWVEPLAQHLVKRSYSEPHWEKDRASVVAYEKVTLYGVPLVAARKVGYGRVDPALSRELFIRHALVEGDWRTHHAFFEANRRLLEDVEDLEHRARRRDLVVDDEALFAFYDARVPESVVSGRHFDSWWKKARRTQPELLTFTRELLLEERAQEVTEEAYPLTWRQGDLELPLTYQFEPGSAADGVTVHVPVQVLNRLSAEGFDWQVPGLRHELVTALIRSLPKPVRVRFVPAPDHARAALERIRPEDGPLLDVLTEELHRASGAPVPWDAWDLDKVPAHLRMTFRVEGRRGEVLGEGKDLDELVRALQPTVRRAVSRVVSGVERAGLTAWPDGDLPRRVQQQREGHLVEGFPALADEGATVAVRVMATPSEQEAAHAAGTRRLLLLTTPSPVKGVVQGLSNRAKLALSDNPHGGVLPLLEDCLAAAVDGVVADQGGPAWDAGGFARLRDAVRAESHDRLEQVLAQVEQVLATASSVRRRITGTTVMSLLPALTDARAQLDGLVHPGFVAEAGTRRLPDLVRYLRALDQRLQRLPDDPHRDRAAMVQVQRAQEAYEETLAALAPARRATQEVRAVRWMLEELRVSLFAQTLGTAHPVSEKRILKALAAL